MSLSNTLPPPPTAALANSSTEVEKEKLQLRRTLLTLTSFPEGLAQPVSLAKLGLITRRPGFALPSLAFLQLSLLTVPLGLRLPQSEQAGFGQRLGAGGGKSGH